MAYVYRHIRHDKNEPFYIGIGIDQKYHRAGERTRRNDLWKKIVSKTSYDIEIIIDNIDYEYAKVKEIEFIALYGRIINNTGTLANFSTGGEGGNGHIVSEETRLKMSLAQKGRKKSPEQIEKTRKSKIGIKMPPRTKEHQAKLDASKIGRPRSEETKKKLSIANIGKISPRRRKVGKYDFNWNLIKEYDFILQAAKELGRHHCAISDCANGKQKTAYGFKWKYL